MRSMVARIGPHSPGWMVCKNLRALTNETALQQNFTNVDGLDQATALQDSGTIILACPSKPFNDSSKVIFSHERTSNRYITISRSTRKQDAPHHCLALGIWKRWRECCCWVGAQSSIDPRVAQLPMRPNISRAASKTRSFEL